MFLIRNAKMSDLKSLHRLSRQLRTLNLPSRESELRKMLCRSSESFAGQHVSDKENGQFVFVMEDTAKGCIVGASKIFARHGTPERPHLYLQVLDDTVASKSLGVRFQRRRYRLKQDKRGYTEVGGLILDPRYRRRPDKLGKQLSLIRFVYMRTHPSYFLRRVIAELLPPLHRGKSRLWDCYGHKLTQLPYHRADLLSFKSKEFILKLFPKADLYHDLLPLEVQSEMGQTGPGSAVAQHMLTQIGFRYAEQIDPFDGGPHYIARRETVTVYQQTRCLRYAGIHRRGRTQDYLVMLSNSRHVRALCTPASVRKGLLFLPEHSTKILAAKNGDKVYTYRWP